MIITGDCRDGLDLLDSRSVDAVITDPPYGDTALVWDTRVGGWIPHLARVLKPTGSVWVFGSLRYLLEFLPSLSAHWSIVQDVVWEKHNGSSFHADRFKRVHEHAVQLRLTSSKWADVYKAPVTTPDAVRRAVRRKKRPPHMGNIGAQAYISEDGGPRLMRSVIFARSCHGYAIHPTQKPVEILDPLVRYSCPPGGLVLDPFAGSGSTGEAALRAGRKFLGFELDPNYAQRATINKL